MTNNPQSPIENLKSAWVFPGQGSQAVGMGRDVYDRSAAARAVFAEADQVLGFALSQLCFDGPADTLTQTENAQPALLTTSIALLVAARESGDLVAPHFVAGHSLGEWTALVAAGSITFADALRLVRRRGELMAAAANGTMAAIIGLDLAPLQDICAEASAAGVVVVANENSPGQLVISGSTAGVERAMALAKERSAKRALPLKVSAAFHSPLMSDAARGLAEAIAAVDQIKRPTPPVISNVTAEPLIDPDLIRQELVDQVTAPVRWIASVERMVAEGVRRVIEIGPGNVLTGLIKRIAPEIELINVSDTDGIARWREREAQH